MIEELAVDLNMIPTEGPNTSEHPKMVNPTLATALGTQPTAHDISQPIFFRKRRPLYANGPWVSPVGFGTYRVGESTGSAEVEALTFALAQGINLIDMSPTFANGLAEPFVGSVLKSLNYPREKLVAVSKVGYATGQDMEKVPTFGKKTYFFSNLLTYCLEKSFIKTQILRSCENLRLEALDCVMLHNPDSILKFYELEGFTLEKSRETFYDVLGEVFGFLEEFIKEGIIGSYGISSQGFCLGPESSTALAVEACVMAARTAGGSDHHFKVIQCPLNWIEPEASLCADGSGEHSALYAAQKLGLGVLVNRPFNAMANNSLLRLTRPQERWRAQAPSPEAWENWHTLAKDLEYIARQNLTQVGFEDVPLSQLVLRSLVHVPGVTAVLTGMRHVDYVQDALNAMLLPSLVNSREFLANIYSQLEFHS